jgi:competence protein ComEA
MKPISGLKYVLFGAMALTPLIPALAWSGQDNKNSNTSNQDLPPGEGKDLLVKTCAGCHLLTVVTSERKTESAWADTVAEMRSRGANGSDEDMDKIIQYLATNFGPKAATDKVNVNSASAADMVTGLSLSQAEAEAIVSYRTKNGKFKDIAGLKQVPGVEAAKIDAAKDRIDF